MDTNKNETIVKWKVIAGGLGIILIAVLIREVKSQWRAYEQQFAFEMIESCRSIARFEIQEAAKIQTNVVSKLAK